MMQNSAIITVTTYTSVVAVIISQQLTNYMCRFCTSWHSLNLHLFIRVHMYVCTSFSTDLFAREGGGAVIVALRI